MPDRQQTTLKFPLEETVWFERGQEVENLLSISLDPYISIVDDDEFVILKGSLTLSGEYNALSLHEEGETDLNPAKSFIQSVNVRDDETCDFNHAFPVDITIPRHRIENLDEIEITVESFDYDLPEAARLKIEAEVFVHGIYEEVTDDAPVIVEDEKALLEEITRYEEENQNLNYFPPSEIEVENELEEEVEEDRVEIDLVQYQPHEDQVAEEDHPSVEELEKRDDIEENLDELEEIAEETEQTIEFEREKAIETQLEIETPIIEETETMRVKIAEEPEEINVPELSRNLESSNEIEQPIDDFYESFHVEARALPETVDDDWAKKSNVVLPELPKLTFDSDSNQTESINLNERNPYNDYENPYESSSFEEIMDAYVQDVQQVEEKPKKKKKDKYQTISFADFFARKEEETSSKMRVCIVQEGDTIQSIADRYDIHAQQILRANNIEASHEVHEGQALYIPEKTIPSIKALNR